MERILSQLDDLSDWLATGRRALRSRVWLLILSLPGIMLVLLNWWTPSAFLITAAATAACLAALIHLLAAD